MLTIIYLLIVLSIFVAFLVILLENPVYAVLSLVFLFLLNSIILLFLEVEFFALLYIIVYVGAVAVLFLFVIMMLDLRKKLIGLHVNYKLFFFFLLFGLYNIIMTLNNIVSFSFTELLTVLNVNQNSLSYNISGLTDIYALNILFSKNYGFLIIIVAIMFFIVMLGTINLHLQQENQNSILKKRNISNLTQHGLKNSIKLRGQLKDISFYEKVLYSDWTFIVKLNFRETLDNSAIINHFYERRKRINALRLWDNLQMGIPFDFYLNISYLNLLQPGLFNFFDYVTDEAEYVFHSNLDNFFCTQLNYNILFFDFYDTFNYDV